MGLLCMDEYLDERISPVKLIYWPDEATQIPAHWHTNMELNFIASGAMSLLENGRELRMEAGAVHFMNSGVVHRMEVGDSLGLTLVFSNKFIRELCPGTTAPHFDWNACPQQQEALREAVLPMYRLSQELYLNGQKIEDDPYTYLLVNSYLYRIAYLMVRYFRADTPEESSQVSGTNYHIQQAVDYIEKHFKEDLSAADVAAKAGLSREHFSRIFREYTGVTFKRFLTSLRLAVAYRLLVPDFRTLRISPATSSSITAVRRRSTAGPVPSPPPANKHFAYPCRALSFGRGRFLCFSIITASMGYQPQKNRQKISQNACKRRKFSIVSRWGHQV